MRRLFFFGVVVLSLGALALVFVTRPFEPRRLPRERIDREAADLLFDWAVIGEAFRYDEEAVLLAIPNRDERWNWEEHHEGAFTMSTNDLGFVETEPTLVEKTGPRILVLGDSHTQGLANAVETYANVLEGLLNEGGRDPEVEVVNAGVGYTGPYFYARRLEKYLHLEPDVVVAALFTGNDFWDDLLVHYVLAGEREPTGDGAYYRRIDGIRERFPGMVYQGLNQAYRFKHFPHEAELALDRVLRSFEEMKAMCAANDIELVALALPTKIDVDIGDRLEDVAVALELLELSVDDYGINRRLGRRFAEELERRGIPCVDPAEEMQSSRTVFYWRKDDHLAVTGHALVARRLHELLSTRF